VTDAPLAVDEDERERVLPLLPAAASRGRLRRVRPVGSEPADLGAADRHPGLAVAGTVRHGEVDPGVLLEDRDRVVGPLALLAGGEEQVRTARVVRLADVRVEELLDDLAGLGAGLRGDQRLARRGGAGPGRVDHLRR